MSLVDSTYGRIPVTFPPSPYRCQGIFAAYLVSFLPDDPEHRLIRRMNLRKQLRWWRLMTDMPVHVLASNWRAAEIANESELAQLPAHGGSVVSIPSRPLIDNRIACLRAFYSSEHLWGVMMDDDAILYHSPDHNSGAAFFAEMAQNDAAAYRDIDVFFPINPAKRPGQNIIWSKSPRLYATRHVFDANYDLKGSLFVVRNFRLDGRTEVLPPASFTLHGEDTLFAIQAVSQGRTVFRCENIVLKELTGRSHFAHDLARMQEGNEAIAALFAHQGLRMNSKTQRSHLLDRSTFVNKCLSGRPARVVVAKP